LLTGELLTQKLKIVISLAGCISGPEVRKKVNPDARQIK